MDAQWITLLTVIAGFCYQAYRETRQRRWDREDRKELAKTVVLTASKVAEKVEAVHVQLGEAITVNTEISTKAFHEANSVNLKIEKLGLEHNALQRQESDREYHK